MNKTIAAMFGAGVVGGAIVAGVIGVSGLGSSTTTVLASQSAINGKPISVAQDQVLSAREIYRRDAPGVVFIKATVTRTQSDPFGFGGEQSGVATGSGFVISDKGYILTNFHVVDGASAINVTFDDKKSVAARVLGRDASTDLALLKVDPKGANLHPLTLGQSSEIQVGDPVLAIGNPFGLDRTLTTGVVSALQRNLKAPNGFTINDVIQTDAAINPGNSGGPLLNSAGQVIGVNSQIETGGGSSGNVGIGFAVPIDTARKILPQLEQGQSVERGWLGVEVASVDSSMAALKLPVDSGALIQRITPNSPAAKSGLLAGTKQQKLSGQPITTGGDIIIAANGREIRTAEDLQAAIGGEKPGSVVEITVKRGDKTIKAKVKLAPRPAHG